MLMPRRILKLSHPRPSRRRWCLPRFRHSLFEPLEDRRMLTIDG